MSTQPPYDAQRGAAQPGQPQQAAQPGPQGAAADDAGPAQPASSAGAVDLSDLGGAGGSQQAGTQPGAQGAPQASGGPSGLGQWSKNLTEEGLQEFVQLTTRVPALVVGYSQRSDGAEAVVRTVDQVVEENAGKYVLGVVDVDHQPRVAQALQIQQVPMLLAILGGRPMPLFAGPVERDQVDATLQELQQVAVQQGMAGSVPPINVEQEATQETGGRFAEADQLLAQSDYAGARQIYQAAAEQNPSDAEAEAGVHRVNLLERVSNFDAQQVRSAAAQQGDDVQAQMDVADLDIAGGHVEDAFNRLITFIGSHHGEDREAARVHLVELFSVVGADDQRVASGRRKLAMSLF